MKFRHFIIYIKHMGKVATKICGDEGPLKEQNQEAVTIPTKTDAVEKEVETNDNDKEAPPAVINKTVVPPKKTEKKVNSIYCNI